MGGPFTPSKFSLRWGIWSSDLPWEGQFPSTFPAVKNDCCDDTLLAVTPRRLAATCDRLLQVSAWLTNMAVYFLIPLAKYQQS